MLRYAEVPDRLRPPDGGLIPACLGAKTFIDPHQQPSMAVAEAAKGSEV
jgi:hypothetical protein